ncbi:hypothetical protein [Novosphingobium mangrovi (ex Huang et al. 2023)]|uniref:Uncharacterized protein n=1 Tax=Novosphingobium mangrovi (ex Huang et al. 2023) TaxID=2976432 RepID=A0ABT2I4R3_9SPHN|nr:hypothetical protein [Novosphingobium mangrovi (ex Huang et al. 2023)]MCT2399797.1 hypothetical protein [Novosphingobium mangrovi (ex Huang et al. 2023)]
MQRKGKAASFVVPGTRFVIASGEAERQSRVGANRPGLPFGWLLAAAAQDRLRLRLAMTKKERG